MSHEDKKVAEKWSVRSIPYMKKQDGRDYSPESDTTMTASVCQYPVVCVVNKEGKVEFGHIYLPVCLACWLKENVWRRVEQTLNATPRSYLVSVELLPLQSVWLLFDVWDKGWFSLELILNQQHFYSQRWWSNLRNKLNSSARWYNW